MEWPKVIAIISWNGNFGTATAAVIRLELSSREPGCFFVTALFASAEVYFVKRR